MVRTQIQLTAEQAAVLKQLAATRGISMAELIRQSVDRFVKSEGTPSREELVKRAKAAVGKFKTRSGAVSSNHDRYLADAFLHR